MKIPVILLTGDGSVAAEAVATELGIFHFHADLRPEQKTAEITRRTRRGEVVAMLGDGINDAPTLSEATVGIAMGAGTDVARESADVVLIGNDLMTFVETVRIARKCRKVILELLRNAYRRCNRNRACRGGIPQSSAGSVHSCCVGTHLHSEFHPATPISSKEHEHQRRRRIRVTLFSSWQRATNLRRSSIICRFQPGNGSSDARASNSSTYPETRDRAYGTTIQPTQRTSSEAIP